MIQNKHLIPFEKTIYLSSPTMHTEERQYVQEAFDTNWLSCLLIDPSAMCSETRGAERYSYVPEHRKSCPMEILNTLQSIRAQGRPIWKPMHMQPYYEHNAYITKDGSTNVGLDIYSRGLCLPSDNKMTPKEQDRVIEAIRACFD